MSGIPSQSRSPRACGRRGRGSTLEIETRLRLGVPAGIEQQLAQIRAGGLVALHVVDCLTLSVEGGFVGAEVGIKDSAVRQTLPSSGAQDDDSIDVVVDDLAPAELAIRHLISDSPLRAHEIVVDSGLQG